MSRKTYDLWLEVVQKVTDEELLSKIMDNHTKTRVEGHYGKETDHNLDLSDAIDSGFTWANTPEGHDYWDGIFRQAMKDPEQFTEPIPLKEIDKKYSI